jgi:hypothetical protein
MSLIITVNLEEAIVMASDSRLSTISHNVDMYSGLYNAGNFTSDHHAKTRVLFDRVGISSYGQAIYGGKGLDFHFSCIESEIKDYSGDMDVANIAYHIAEYFQKYDPDLSGGFHVGGYDTENGIWVPKVFRILHVAPYIYQMNLGPRPDTYKLGVMWNGETEVVSKLYGTESEKHALLSNDDFTYSIPWRMMGIQDGIDFCMHLINTTSSYLRFSGRQQSVGGNVSVLVIKPNQLIWKGQHQYMVAGQQMKLL